MQPLTVQDRINSYDLTDAEADFVSRCLNFWRNWTPVPCCEGFVLYEKLNEMFSREPQDSSSPGSPDSHIAL